ncbi:conserved protein of unknown function [Candidatus Promineifilum breve]|uniref:YdhG-like domain-containing protein n=1 Tax=Candidatus Promineifilum breve TaxID=1806508 RepID=A0A160T9V7_9CHLR|nr:DUF1801 domain-containing protein [Candidatus Promineifilum breve]CUS06085.1 conserved protein of unknown function [Candidatus Promineifilum breve]
MSENSNKTQFNDAAVTAFLDAVPDERKRRDSYVILEMMREISGEEPRMYGTSIVGFGNVHYQYESGREGDMPVVAFSPRKQNLTLYITTDDDEYEALRARLGKHKVGKVCLYINKLADVDPAVLREMISHTVSTVRAG